jgi:hypothetical protein
LFWKRDLIYFGAGSNRGHLKGVPAKSVKSKPCDFRDQQGIYCLYDENFKLVYVGQAGSGVSQRLFDRLKQRKRDAVSERWSKFSWFGLNAVIGEPKNPHLKAEKKEIKPVISGVLDHMEAVLISAGEPTHNLQSGRFGNSVVQYLQHVDEEHKPLPQEDALYSILDDLGRIKKNLGLTK